MAVVLTVLTVPGGGSSTAQTTLDEAPDVFALRLEGFAVRGSATANARNANPGSGYSFGKIDSTPAIGDGGRRLQMKAVASNNDPGDLGGAALFAPTTPTNGAANFPGYAEAFFPFFENQNTVSEKCATNVEPREAPECRTQPGPYALARVVPDQDTPSALGYARNVGEEDASDDNKNAETVTESRITVESGGALLGRQVNEGRRFAVPGTPIVVESFRASSEVRATPEGVQASGTCTASVNIAGESFDTNRELQALLGPFGSGSGVRVAYTPPTDPKIVELADGGKEVSCTGARFEVIDPQTSTTSHYTYGKTFATSGVPVDEIGGDPLGDGATVSGAGASSTPPPSSPADAPSTSGASTDTPSAPAPSGGTSGTEDTTSAAPPTSDDPRNTAPSTGSGGGLVEETINTTPLAATTAATGLLLPLALWLLLGVTGSLARGYDRLRLPPFRRG